LSAYYARNKLTFTETLNGSRVTESESMNPDFTGLPEDFHGGQFSWKSPGSSGAMSFEVTASTLVDGRWRLECVDGNGRPFVARGSDHARAMWNAMGVAMGMIPRRLK